MVAFPCFFPRMTASKSIVIELTDAKPPALSKASVDAERDPRCQGCYRLKLPIACYRQPGMKGRAPTSQPEMLDQRKLITLKLPVYSSFRGRQEKISLGCGAYKVRAYGEGEKRKDQRSKSVYSLNLSLSGERGSKVKVVRPN